MPVPHVVSIMVLHQATISMPDVAPSAQPGVENPAGPLPPHAQPVALPPHAIQPGQPAQPTQPSQPGQPVSVSVGDGKELTLVQPAAATAADVATLRARRSELSNQITSAQGRRNSLVKELTTTPEGVARTGLEQRLEVLDQRIVQLEQDIAENGKALAQYPELTTESALPGVMLGGFSSGQMTAISIIFIGAVLAPVMLGLVRILARRWGQPKPDPRILESTARLERMEQAIDAIAIEVERISEGQRFVTQIVADRSALSLRSGQQPEVMPVGAARAPEPVQAAATRPASE